MERKAWFCPTCNKHHAPHCDTCPAPVDARPLPGITVPYQPPVYPSPYIGDPLPLPWVPYTPVTCSGVPVRGDGGTIFTN